MTDPPSWKDDKPPEDVTVVEEGSANFTCRADGEPRPAVTWTSNGGPIESIGTSCICPI